VIPRGRTLLIVAALEEELRPAIESLRLYEKEAGRPARTGRHAVEGRVRFLRTGVGPGPASRSLRRALEKGRTNGVLITGYAGALDPGLRVGDLVTAQRATLLSREGGVRETWAMWAPDFLLETAKAAGLNAFRGDIATSHVPVVDPGQRSLFFDRFGAAVVDMETAALARVAAGLHVPVACVRVVTDEATDIFEPGSPESHRSSWWEQRTVVARQSLSAFFATFFEAGGPSLRP